MNKSERIKAYVELMKEFDKLPQEEKPAAIMPELPIWMSKSFILTSLSIVLLVSSVLDFDVMAWLKINGIGDSMPQVVSNIELILLGVLQLLAYRERLKPNYKLVWKRIASIAADDEKVFSMLQTVNSKKH